MNATAAAAIRLDGVRKVYPDGTQAVRGLSLEVAAGELVVLVGPSGCGKSTILRMVNRLVEPSGGRIHLGGEDVTDVDPVALRRRMGYVIQHVGLFPHQTVRDNVATVPRLLGWPRGRVEARVEEMLDLVGLDGRPVCRAVPARALRRPAAAGRRGPRAGRRTRSCCSWTSRSPPSTRSCGPACRRSSCRLQRQVGKTIVFVTHDVDEAVRLGDRIAVLSEGGTLEQYADPATMLAEPANDFVAEFVGADRAIKLLGVTPIPPDLEPVPATSGAGLPTVDSDATLRDALAVLMETGSDRVGIRGPDGSMIGTLPLSAILRSARARDAVN